MEYFEHFPPKIEGNTPFLLTEKPTIDPTCIIRDSYLGAYTQLMKNTKEFKSVDEYEAYREKKAKRTLSAKELKNEELKAIKERKDEEERLNRLKMYDKKIEKFIW